MQSLSPPFPVVDGYALLPDHADRTLWYALPRAPRLAMADGGPQLSIVEYLGGGAGAAKTAGALVQLTTELGIPDEDLDRLARQLGSVVPDLPGKARVVPVTFDSGSVELAVLGRTATPGPAGSAAPGGPFEVVFTAGGRPSLGARNEAAFQLMVNAAAAELLAESLDQPELPVLVTYAMTFPVLRPGFTLDIKADWSKVYSSLRERLGVNAWFAASEVDRSVIRALEVGGVDVDLVVLDEDSQGSATSIRDRLLDWVLERLFQPMAPPTTTAQSVGQAIGDAVWSVSRAILPGVSYRLRTLDEQQVRHLDVRATETVAESRELRPQGTLGALLRSLRLDENGKQRPTWPAVRAGMLQQVELDGFPRVEVAVEVVDRFASDGLRGVRVQLARQLPDGRRADLEELAFTAPGQQADYVVNLLDDAARGAALDTPYAYRVLVDFAADSPLLPGASVTGTWTTYAAASLVVDPREAYSVGEVTVAVAPLFSFDLFPAVTVELRPGPDGGVPTGGARVTLGADEPTERWVFAADRALPAGGAPAYSFRPTYSRPLATGGNVVGAWQTGVEPWLSLPDPMPEKLDVAFFVDLPWTDITAALLQVYYDDPDHSVRYERETVPLGPDTPVVRRGYSIATGGARTVHYRLTVKLARGGLLEGSWREATDDRIAIDRRLVDERQVLLRVVGGTLADSKLREIKVGLQVREPATGDVRTGTEITVLPGTESGFVAPFRYLLGDPPVRQVFHQVVAIDRNGFVVRRPWQPSTADLLVLNLRTTSIES